MPIEPVSFRAAETDLLLDPGFRAKMVPFSQMPAPIGSPIVETTWGNYVPRAVYQTPEGYFDSPFLYGFDCRGLTDGLDYEGLVRLVDGTGDFILRRIWGTPTVLQSGGTGRFQYRNASQSSVYQRPIVVDANPCDQVVVPEKPYPAAGGIGFDLYDVQRATNGSGQPYAFLVFQGVRRFRGSQDPPGYLRTGPYRLKPYGYRQTFVEPALGTEQILVTQIDQGYDFELWGITAWNVTAGVVDPGAFLISMLSPTDEQFMNVPVPIGAVIEDPNNNQGVFPVPTVVYPSAGSIRFRVVSLSAAANTWELCFHGAHRVYTP